MITPLDLDTSSNVISNFWAASFLAIIFFSFLKYNLIWVKTSSCIFLIFGFLAGLRGSEFNGDTHNYILQFQSYQDQEWSKLFSIASDGWFEPAYNTIVFFSSKIMAADDFILFITLIPTLIFAYQFVKYQYHPAIIANIFSSMILVAATTTVRHYLVLSFLFVVFNFYVFNKRIAVSYLTMAVMTHYSTIAIAILFLVENFKSLIKKKFFLYLVFVSLPFLAIYAGEFLSHLFGKFLDRATQETQSQGLRQLVVFFIFFLFIHANGILKLNRIRLIHILALGICIIIFINGWFGINRVVSFVHLIFLVYLSFHCFRGRETGLVNIFLLNMVSVVSFLLFFNFHRIS